MWALVIHHFPLGCDYRLFFLPELDSGREKVSAGVSVLLA